MQKSELNLEDVRAELRAGNRVLLMTRHAERPHIDHDDPTFGAALPITENGKRMCLAFGQFFRAFAGETQFLASPLRRTRMTAEWIAKGMGFDAPEIPVDGRLGNETPYFADARAVWEEFRDGRFFEKIFAYFARGTFRGFADLGTATDELETWALGLFTAKLGIFATHDLYNGAYLYARGVKTDWTVANWLRFLDSAAIILEPGGARRYALVRAGLSDRVVGVD